MSACESALGGSDLSIICRGKGSSTSIKDVTPGCSPEANNQLGNRNLSFSYAHQCRRGCQSLSCHVFVPRVIALLHSAPPADLFGALDPTAFEHGQIEPCSGLRVRIRVSKKGVLGPHNLSAAPEHGFAHVHSSSRPRGFLLALRKNIVFQMLGSNSWACAVATPVVSAEREALEAWR
jgi:hypothetical protein